MQTNFNRLIYQNHFRSSSCFVSLLFDRVGGTSLQEERNTRVYKGSIGIVTYR